MKNIQIITSFQNPKFKSAVALQERRDRKKEKHFLIEGFRELTRALIGGVKLQAVWICPELFLGTHETELIEKIEKNGGEVFQVPEGLFKKLSYRDRPDGLVGVGRFMDASLQDLKKAIGHKENCLILVAEGIEKPGNLGSMLRSADAVATDGVISCDPRTDIYNPNAVRSSVGTLFTQPVVEATAESALEFLRKEGFILVAATPYGNKTYTNASLQGRIALVMGCEQLGLSKLWMEACDVQVKIPMLGVADSLNVSTAATLLLYEYRRQNALPHCL